MLEQPGPHDVGGDLRENAALLLPLLVALVVIIFAGAITGAYARVAQERTFKVKNRKFSLVKNKTWRTMAQRNVLSVQNAYVHTCSRFRREIRKERVD